MGERNFGWTVTFGSGYPDNLILTENFYECIHFVLQGRRPWIQPDTKQNYISVSFAVSGESREEAVAEGQITLVEALGELSVDWLDIELVSAFSDEDFTQGLERYDSTIGELRPIAKVFELKPRREND